MNDNSEAHNLGQILRLLHLAPVTFRPGLPYYKDFEPLRKSEFLWVDNDDKPSKTETKTETKTSKAYDYITAMIEESKLNGKVITQDDIFKKIKKLDPELYKNYLEGEVTPVFKI